MPPRKRRTKKDPGSLMAIFEKYATEAGVEFNVSKEAFEETGDNDPLARKLEGEAIVKQLEYAMKVVTKRCQNCGEIFQTTYTYDGFCTYQCTEQYLRQTYGFVYSGSKPVAERWSFQHWRMAPPMKINPGMLKALEQFAHKFLQDLEGFRTAESESQSQSVQDQDSLDQDSLEQDHFALTQMEELQPPTEHLEYPQPSQEHTQEQASFLSLPDIEVPDTHLSF